MKKNKCKKIIYVLFFSFLTSSVYAGEIVDKKYREQFLSKEAIKNYYRKQVNVSNYFSRQTSAVNGLVESFRGTSIYTYDIFSKGFIYGKTGVLDAQSFTYDGAIAALAYLTCNQQQKASDILDVYRKEFYRVKNDNYGIYNSYQTDKKATQWGLVAGIDGDRMHAGPTVWVAIAALQYTAVTGDLDFLPFVVDICKWVEALPHYSLKNGQRGAASMGFGWGPDWSKIYSTENVIDHYALLKMLSDVYAVNDVKIREIFVNHNYSLLNIKREMFDIEKWLVEVVYDPEKKTFNVGANEHGVDTIDALDTVSWMITALGPQRLSELNVDPYYLMQFADENYYVEDTINNTVIRGYDFTNLEGRQKDYRMVWFEGTGFHIIALQAMAKFAFENGNLKRAEYFKQKAKYFLNEMDKASAACGMIDGALPYTSKKPNEKEIYTTFHYEWEIPRGRKGQWVSSASSTGWHMLASSAFDPLGFDKRNVNYKLFKQTSK
ncbi:MAG: hypothetical protein LBR69_03265 [Endomicrobium sp.]|jgi:hypothetical protein|nr:hypothetical protein [Endomicrobium sp.]